MPPSPCRCCPGVWDGHVPVCQDLRCVCACVTARGSSVPQHCCIKSAHRQGSSGLASGLLHSPLCIHLSASPLFLHRQPGHRRVRDRSDSLHHSGRGALEGGAVALQLPTHAAATPSLPAPCQPTNGVLFRVTLPPAPNEGAGYGPKSCSTSAPSPTHQPTHGHCSTSPLATSPTQVLATGPELLHRRVNPFRDKRCALLLSLLSWQQPAVVAAVLAAAGGWGRF